MDNQNLFIIDSHCHLDTLDYQNQTISDVLHRANKAGVKHIVSVCTSLSNFAVIEKLQSYKEVSITCGIHPLYVADEPFDQNKLLELASKTKVVAVGETGLDYHYSTDKKVLQKEIFTAHLEVAQQLQKPLIIHCRKAGDDTIAMLKDFNCKGVMHCFTEDYETAKKALDLGFYISLSGIVTFKKATELQETVKKLPLDCLMIETDSPYLAPEPFRGKPSEPAFTRQVCEFIAKLKNESIDRVAKITTANTAKLFALNI